MKKQILSEEFKRMQKIAGLVQESKIDEIALVMIQKVSAKEIEFYQNLEEIKKMKSFSFEHEKENFEELFRKINISIDEVNRIKLANKIEIPISAQARHTCIVLLRTSAILLSNPAGLFWSTSIITF